MSDIMTLHYRERTEVKMLSFYLQNAANPPGKGKSGSRKPAAAAASIDGPEVM